MRFKWSLWGLGLLSLSLSAHAIPNDGGIRVIVKYKHNLAYSSLKSQVIKDAERNIEEMNPMANGAYSITFKSSLGHGATDKILAKLRKNPNVVYAVKDRVGYFKPVPDPIVYDSLSPLLSHESQWDEFLPPAGIMLESKPGLRDGAWAYTTGSAANPVVVAVLDTGIARHSSLENTLLKDKDGRIWGWNFAGNNNQLDDETESYHGTHVSGIIAGYGDVMNGVGDALKIVTVKIPAADGMFYESAVINGIYWSVGASIPGIPANPYPARVLNMSFGVDKGPGQEIDYCDEALQEAVFFARDKGAVLIAAAGNDNRWEHYNAPAVCNGTIKVASTGPEGLRSYFSNYGPGVTLAAPGGDKRYGIMGGILSTVNPGGGYNASGFDFYQGTSMAAPHVAGVAGLIFASSQKSLTAEQVEQMLYTTTHDFGKTTDDNKSCIGSKPCGHGILDAYHAVKAAINAYDVYLSSPNPSSLQMYACEDGGIDAIQATIRTASAVWVQQESRCQSLKAFQHPTIEKNQNGAIIAHYEGVSYQLDQSAFSECDVLGFDGVGCYLK